MAKRTGVLAAAILVLATVSILNRRDPEAGGPVREPRAVLPAAVNTGEPPATRPADTSAPPETVARTEAGPRNAEPEAVFWEEVGSLLEARPSLGEEGQRKSILEATSRYLGLDRTQAQVFEAVTRQAIQEIESSWQMREVGWLAVSANVTLDAELREQAERDVQERYETGKKQALARIEAVLGSGPRSALLRERLEEWMDAVR